jgi:hypothetical protein
MRGRLARSWLWWWWWRRKRKRMRMRKWWRSRRRRRRRRRMSQAPRASIRARLRRKEVYDSDREVQSADCS